MTQLKKRWALLGIGACAACCAIPLAGTLGLGVGTGSAVAAWQWLKGDWICLLIILSTVLGAGWLYTVWRRRSHLKPKPDEKNQSTCQTTCATDQSCCNGENQHLELSGCSLHQGQLDERILRFQKLFKGNFIKSWRENTAVFWAFHSTPDTLQESQELARLESVCCSELTFEVTLDHNQILWRIFAPTGNSPLLDLFELLPEEICSPDGTKRLINIRL
jgi:hypothetical protein